MGFLLYCRVIAIIILLSICPVSVCIGEAVDSFSYDVEKNIAGKDYGIDTLATSYPEIDIKSVDSQISDGTWNMTVVLESTVNPDAMYKVRLFSDDRESSYVAAEFGQGINAIYYEGMPTVEDMIVETDQGFSVSFDIAKIPAGYDTRTFLVTSELPESEDVTYSDALSNNMADFNRTLFDPLDDNEPLITGSPPSSTIDKRPAFDILRARREGGNILVEFAAPPIFNRSEGETYYYLLYYGNLNAFVGDSTAGYANYVLYNFENPSMFMDKISIEGNDLVIPIDLSLWDLEDNNDGVVRSDQFMMTAALSYMDDMENPQNLYTAMDMLESGITHSVEGGGGGTQPPAGEEYIVQLTDTHVGSISESLKDVNNGADVRLSNIIKAINTFPVKPTAVVVTGDLSDWGAGEGGRANLQLFVRIMDTLNVPWYAVSGNHDYRFSGELSNYKSVIAEHDINNGYVELGNSVIIGLEAGPDDLTSWKGHWMWPESTGLSNITLDWLEDTLAKFPDKQKLIAMHNPVINYNERSELDGVIGNNRERFLLLCNQYDVKAVLAGHTHRNIDDVVPGYYVSKTYHFQTASVVSELAWRNVTITKDGISSMTYTLGPTLTAGVECPVRLHLHDGNGGIIGRTGDEIRVPDGAVYLEDENGSATVSVYGTDGYSVDVEGTGDGSYNLTISTNDGTEDIKATGIRTLEEAVHTYEPDWDASAEKRVSVTIDKDGDGEADKTFTSDGSVTTDEVGPASHPKSKPKTPVPGYAALSVITVLAAIGMGKYIKYGGKKTSGDKRRGGGP